MSVPTRTDAPAGIIEIDGLWTCFDDVVVHRNLHLSVQRGEIVALVGGSGSGKTTLLRQMLGLEKPTRGTVSVFGEDLNPPDNQRGGADLQQLRNRWGVLFQHGALFSALNVLDNVAQPMRELRHLPDELIREAALLKLNMVGISVTDAQKMPAELSGGMVKRVALARALSLEPELLFLDEPTAGLDPNLSDTFVELIRTLHSELCLTVVMVTHDLDTIFELSTQVAVLAEQQVIAYERPDRVCQTDHPFIREFFLGPRGRRAVTALGSAAAHPA